MSYYIRAYPTKPLYITTKIAGRYVYLKIRHSQKPMTCWSSIHLILLLTETSAKNESPPCAKNNGHRLPGQLQLIHMSQLTFTFDEVNWTLMNLLFCCNSGGLEFTHYYNCNHQPPQRRLQILDHHNSITELIIFLHQFSTFEKQQRRAASLFI